MCSHFNNCYILFCCPHLQAVAQLQENAAAAFGTKNYVWLPSAGCLVDFRPSLINHESSERRDSYSCDFLCSLSP